MSRSKAPIFIGTAAVGGLGYYLYSAGGDPNVAKKQAEADAHRASARIKSELPGRGEEYKKEAEVTLAQAGAKIDSYTNKAHSELQKATSNAEAYAKSAKADALKKVDQFDATVERKAAEAKNGVSSWLGFGGK